MGAKVCETQEAWRERADRLQVEEPAFGHEGLAASPGARRERQAQANADLALMHHALKDIVDRKL